MTSRAQPPEAFVSWLWSQQVGQTLTTMEGCTLQVVYPGRRHGAAGPDYRGALLTFDGCLTRGDVEIHVRGAGWEQHRHRVDPMYAQTVLHVVLDAGHGAPARRLDGLLLPTVELRRAVDPAMLKLLLARWSAGDAPVLPIRACLNGAEALATLDRAGLARFYSRVARFEGDLTAVSPAQALWAGLLETLGYATNVAPFRALADRVPEMEAELAVLQDGEPGCEALLLGEAGLLPSQIGSQAFDGYVHEAEERWRASKRSGPRPLGWRWLGVRPGNSPARRVAAAAALVADTTRWPVEVHARAILANLPPRRAASALDALLERAGGEYWRSHYDFGRHISRPGDLIGQERARDGVVNALLPWAAALGRSGDEGWLVRAAEAAYEAHPALASNQITRHMARQILGPDHRSVRLNAQRQQGLIHIYRGWCDARDCAACLAGPGPRSIDLTLQSM